jgi:polyisoprenoid-binding protein YceI
MMKRYMLIFLCLLFLAVPQVSAYEWKLDMAHSAVMFEIKHIYSKVRGQFGEFSGDVFFNPDDPQKSKFKFTVEVKSINTFIGKRDNHLRSGDFFDASKYPQMIFKSSKVSPVGGNKYRLEGNMTVKDVTKPMTIEFQFLGQKDSPFKKGSVVGGFETRFTIDRLEFNVGTGKYYEMGVIGKNVDVFISLEMIRNK